MTVSIIIPIYNVSDYVERCLQSVMEQSYQDIECILVDDHTPDDSIEKCQRMIDEYRGPIQFKILHHEQNRGLSAARNTGMDAANGEYIFFLDSDDYIYPNCIKCLIEAINKEEGIDWAWGGYNVSNSFSVRPMIPGGVYENDFLMIKQFIKIPMAYNKLFSSHFINKYALRFMEGLIHEDDLWSFIVACHTSRISICEDITYYYRKNPKGIMAQPLSIRYPHYCRVYSEMIHYAKANNLWTNRYVYEYINKQLKRIYLIPIYNNEPSLTFFYYTTLRRESFWSIPHVWDLSKKWERCFIHLHRLLPLKMGYKFFQYYFSKFF